MKQSPTLHGMGCMSSIFNSEPRHFGFAKQLETEPGSALTEVQARSWMDELDARQATRRLRCIPGRETYLISHSGRPLVVKTTHGDLQRERWYDHFHGQSGRLPGQREFDNLCELRLAGFRVPEPIGWARDSDGRSLVAMEYVAHREDLAQRLCHSKIAERERFGRQVAAWVARLHGAGFYHRDLYLSHFVLAAETDELVLLDLGRVRREAVPRQRWFVKDLAALYHSRPAQLTTREALRFLADYLRRRSASDRLVAGQVSRSELCRWARRVERKAQRLAAHRPKYVDSRSSKAFPKQGPAEA